ncbi:nucleotide-binding universal stress UspA family protein [Oceanisphaera litoralis]|uniref:universal stress protein n=1 Tax=Oceanisphaera litoralis TaxID=225144 RepID=UPI00195695C5|nr:universal stress protein [Oceanisphaera litoralis]MBM7455897.1 nucleotide-binding universal stress UspA family protein [Oceanisphaera litoralis]
MKTLLAAIDLEQESMLVVNRAVELAVRLKASLHLVHVVDDALTLYEPMVEISVRHRLKKAAEMALQGFFDLAPDDVKARGGCHVLLGKPYQTLGKTVEALKADLLIVGRHHIEPLRDLFVGTTAERLLRHCDIPLLMVSTDATDTYEHVLAATDFSRSSHHALKAALWLAPEAEIRLVHVFDPPFTGLVHHDQQDIDDMIRQQQERITREIKTEMAHFMAEDDQSRIRPDIMAGGVQACLNNAVALHGPQLLVLGTHGRHGIGRLLIGSVATSFLSTLPCDVLVAR